MIRGAGCDPGTSSLDILILEDLIVGDQVRFSTEQIRDAPDLPCQTQRAEAPDDSDASAVETDAVPASAAH